MEERVHPRPTWASPCQVSESKGFIVMALTEQNYSINATPQHRVMQSRRNLSQKRDAGGKILMNLQRAKRSVLVAGNDALNALS